MACWYAAEKSQWKGGWVRGWEKTYATVDGYDGPETEGLIDAVLEILAAFQGGEGDVLRVVVCAEGVDDSFLEFSEDVGVSEHFVEEP